MATETLKMLNLSPIPELSDKELSSVLEHLNSVSDMNGEVTDRNVEDILREAEELIDMSSSFKADSFDMDKCCENNGGNKNSVSNNCRQNSKNSNPEIITLDDSESITDMLNLSLSSEDNSEKALKSESIKSSKNDPNSSQTELYSSPTPRSITNHIQSTLDSLRECSKKIENQTKNSMHNVEKDLAVINHKKEESADKLQNNEDKKSKESKTTKKGPCYGEESEKEPSENLHSVFKEQFNAIQTSKPSLKLIEKNKGFKSTVKGLTLNESIKTLNCFERLYRGVPVKEKIESKRWKTSERLITNKKNGKLGKNNNTQKFETLGKVRKLRDNTSSAKKKLYDNKIHVSSNSNMTKENLTDEEISFEKCLSLLQEESDQSNNVDMTSCNYIDFTEKIFMHWAESVSALQGEVEDLKSQLKRNATKDSYSNADSNLANKFSSQENLIHKLKEENLKLFEEIEEIKGRLKMGGATYSNEDTKRSNESLEKHEIVEKLREEVKNINRSLVTAYSENNGILRLEEQFSLLKAKYDQQIGKLENENKKLKEVLAEQSPRLVSTRKHEERKLEIGTQTDKIFGNVDDIAFEVDSLPRNDLLRSESLENCKNCICVPLPKSLETVDVATSPIRNRFWKADNELCSVSVQCRGESDIYDSVCPEDLRKKTVVSKGFHKIENKENITSSRNGCAKTRSVLNSGNQMLNMIKQKKISEHENQLMVTVRALHSEITVKDRDNKKMRNELESLKNQVKRLGVDAAKHKSDFGKKCHVGTQTIGLVLKVQEAYDPLMFQVSKELEEENEALKAKLKELEKIIDLLKDKRINDLQILQKLHEEEIDKLASRLKSQTALTNHLHSLLTSR